MLLSFLFGQSAETLSRERLETVYRESGVMVLRRCRLILRDENLAMDAVQETFIRLALYGKAFEHRDVPLRWLLRTAERCCFEMLKKNKREPLIDVDSVRFERAGDGGYAAGESFEVIRQFWLGMDFKLAEVALLYYVDGLTQEEIAQELNWSRRTVGKKIVALRERAARLKRKIDNV